MKYKPLPDYLTIKNSPIDELGLFTTKPIEEGTYIGIVHIAYIKAEHGMIRTPLGGFGNHSDTPNCFKIHKMDNMDSTYWLVAERDIKAGEEITWKYTLYNVNGE
jgi:hypothetical protein